GAAHHGARGDSAARVGERELEEPEREERDAGRSIRVGRAVEEEELVSDEAVARAEHEREAERPEERAAKARIDDAVQEDVHGRARRRKARLEEEEARLHEEHEEGRAQRPYRVERIHHLGVRSRGLLCVSDVTEVARHAPHEEHEEGYSDRFASY